MRYSLPAAALAVLFTASSAIATPCPPDKPVLLIVQESPTAADMQGEAGEGGEGTAAPAEAPAVVTPAAEEGESAE